MYQQFRNRELDIVVVNRKAKNINGNPGENRIEKEKEKKSELQ